jgi:glycosyltransferase involved in cell wall biosynthesis
LIGSVQSTGGAICFVVPSDAGGGVLSRVRKWTTALHQRGERCSVAILADRSSRYFTKARPEMFPTAEIHQVSYDSCDKALTSARSLASEPVFADARAIVVSKFHNMHVLASELRRRGWGGIHVEVVPSEWGVGLSQAGQNLNACDLAVGVSSEIAATLTRSQGHRGIPIVVCPGGAEIFPLAPSDRDREYNPIRICYVGRLEPDHKRILDLPPVAQGVAAAGMVARWTIVGDGMSREELERRFSAAGLARDVTFAGQITQLEVRALLRTQHFLVLPSAVEGQSNALCEAMEAGVVPVATRVSGSADAVTDGVNGILVDVGNTAEMSRRLCELASDSVRWELFSAAAREAAVTRLSTNASVERLQTAIDAACERRRSGAVTVGTAAESVESRILESKWIPNPVTRLTRKVWRRLRGRPADLMTR